MCCAAAISPRPHACVPTLPRTHAACPALLLRCRQVHVCICGVSRQDARAPAVLHLGVVRPHRVSSAGTPSGAMWHSWGGRVPKLPGSLSGSNRPLRSGIMYWGCALSGQGRPGYGSAAPHALQQPCGCVSCASPAAAALQAGRALCPLGALRLHGAAALQAVQPLGLHWLRGSALHPQSHALCSVCALCSVRRVQCVLRQSHALCSMCGHIQLGHPTGQGTPGLSPLGFVPYTLKGACREFTVPVA